MNEKIEQFYEELSRRVAKAEEEAAASRERQKKEQKSQRLGRMLASLSNLYFTTKGAPSQEFPELKEEADGEAESKNLDRERARLMKAHESIERLRMADERNRALISYQENRQKNDDRRTDAEVGYKANRQEIETRKADADIGYKANRQEIENRKADADIEKRQAEVSGLNAKEQLTNAQTEAKQAETDLRRRQAAGGTVFQQRNGRTKARRLTLREVRSKR